MASNDSNNNQKRSSKRLQDGGNVAVPQDFRILVLFEEEGKYDILSKSNSKIFYYKKIGDTVKLRDKNGTYQGKIVFTGSFEECSSESDRLENIIRHDRNESSYHGSVVDGGACEESDCDDNGDNVRKSDSEEEDSEDEGSIVMDIVREKEKLQQVLPNTLPGFSRNLDLSRIGSHQVTPPSKKRPVEAKANGKHKKQKKNGACAYPMEFSKQNSPHGKTSTPTTAPKTSKDDRSNGAMVDVLKEILAQQFKTNELLQAILEKNREGAVNNSKELPPGDYVLEDGTDLRDLKRPYQATKYAITLAKNLWKKKELQTGIVEPLKPNKTKSTLSPARVKLIKTLIEHFYNPKNFDKVWGKCRASINQMCTDLKNKDPNDDADDENDENDDDGGMRPC